MWRSDPGAVRILDVRTFEEYVFVGHAEMAKNVPILFPRYDPAGQVPGKPPSLSNVPNPDFVADVRKVFGPDATILVICASGGRAAMAADQLARAGFTKVYNILNGLEGDKVDDAGSAYFGKKLKNGWKNCGLPWTYDLDPDLLWAAPGKSNRS